jgi:DNA polymerase-3 subunit gamma/tau
VARRYRPRQFADLIGQEAIARTLSNALASGMVAHAYLFTGARGVGKTSCARILAKALNCQGGPTPTPCDRCSSCIAIGQGEDIDVREIDGASNRGIDDVRAIRQEVATRPTRSRYKIYIIDEVHMLTKESFNALLKTLEEPPPHVKFVFATTEIQKVPVTIVSRCQRFDFAHLPANRIAEHLRRVVDAEKRQAEDEALEMIARRASGSMRDAQSLLDQVFAFAGESLTAEAVRSLLGIPAGDMLAQMAEAILQRDAASALKRTSEAVHAGTAPADLLDQLIDYWRDLLLLACLGDEAKDLHFSGPLRQRMADQARSCDLDLLLAGLDVLIHTRNRLRGTAHTQTLLEIAVVRLARLEQLIPVQQLLDRMEAKAATPGIAPSRSPTGESSGSEVGLVKKNSSPVIDLHEPWSDQLSIDRVWAEALSQIGVMLRGHLEKAGSPAILGPKTLVIRFPAEYNSSYEYCSQTTNRHLVEEAVRASLGAGWSVRIERAVADPASSVKQDTANRVPSVRHRMDQVVKEHPLLARAVEVLGAIPTSMDPDFGKPASFTADSTGGQTRGS